MARQYEDQPWYQRFWRWVRQNSAAISAVAAVVGVIIGIFR